jgi:hypothetical protein
MIWALNEARTQGYAVNEEALRDVTAWTVAPDDPAKVVPKNAAASEEKLVHQHALLLVLGLQAAGDADAAVNDARARLLALLKDDQHDDGSWTLKIGGRPPLVGTKELMTPLMLLALTPGAPKSSGDDSFATTREKGLKWLEQAPPDENLQLTALRLILVSRLARSEEERLPLRSKLLARQNADGGWSQTPEMSSDAYATGQTLYALLAGGLERQSPAVVRAQSYLAKSQAEDGSWVMTSRPATPDAKPAGDLRPITYAGASWAVLGLVRSAPVK